MSLAVFILEFLVCFYYFHAGSQWQSRYVWIPSTSSLEAACWQLTLLNLQKDLAGEKVGWGTSTVEAKDNSAGAPSPLPRSEFVSCSQQRVSSV